MLLVRTISTSSSSLSTGLRSSTGRATSMSSRASLEATSGGSSSQSATASARVRRTSFSTSFTSSSRTALARLALSVVASSPYWAPNLAAMLARASGERLRLSSSTSAMPSFCCSAKAAPC